MKKATILSFAFFYFALVTGVTVSLHYCGDQLESVSFDPFASESCPAGCGMTKADCCHTTHILFSTNVNHVPAQDQTIPSDKLFPAVALFPNEHCGHFTPLANAPEYADILHPPPDHHTDALLMNCILRI